MGIASTGTSEAKKPAISAETRCSAGEATYHVGRMFFLGTGTALPVQLTILRAGPTAINAKPLT